MIQSGYVYSTRLWRITRPVCSPQPVRPLQSTSNPSPNAQTTRPPRTCQSSSTSLFPDAHPGFIVWTGPLPVSVMVQVPLYASLTTSLFIAFVIESHPISLQLAVLLGSALSHCLWRIGCTVSGMILAITLLGGHDMSSSLSQRQSITNALTRYLLPSSSGPP